MRLRAGLARGRTAFVVCLWLCVTAAASALADAKRGAYLFAVAGCQHCHSAKGGALGAGGEALKTPFGVYYGPNITADPETGLGRWRRDDFVRAMRDGRRPDGSFYFPVFPYPSYRGMTDGDLNDLWDYLRTLPAVRQADRRHEIAWPFSWRGLMRFWNWLYLDDPAPPPADPVLARGRYIADHLGHCAECHTPRNLLGARDPDRYWAGAEIEGRKSPNITADPKVGVGAWSAGELDDVLVMGMKPDGDFVGGAMGQVVDSTSALSESDRAALIAYVQSVPPLH